MKSATGHTGHFFTVLWYLTVNANVDVIKSQPFFTWSCFGSPGEGIVNPPEGFCSAFSDLIFVFADFVEARHYKSLYNKLISKPKSPHLDRWGLLGLLHDALKGPIGF